MDPKPTKDIDQSLVVDLVQNQEIQYKHAEYRDGDFVLRLIV